MDAIKISKVDQVTLLKTSGPPSPFPFPTASPEIDTDIYRYHGTGTTWKRGKGKGKGKEKALAQEDAKDDGGVESHKERKGVKGNGKGRAPVRGTLHLTMHHLIFRPDGQSILGDAKDKDKDKGKRIRGDSDDDVSENRKFEDENDMAMDEHGGQETSMTSEDEDVVLVEREHAEEATIMESSQEDDPNKLASSTSTSSSGGQQPKISQGTKEEEIEEDDEMFSIPIPELWLPHPLIHSVTRVPPSPPQLDPSSFNSSTNNNNGEGPIYAPNPNPYSPPKTDGDDHYGSSPTTSENDELAQWFLQGHDNNSPSTQYQSKRLSRGPRKLAPNSIQIRTRHFETYELAFWDRPDADVVAGMTFESEEIGTVWGAETIRREKECIQVWESLKGIVGSASISNMYAYCYRGPSSLPPTPTTPSSHKPPPALSQTNPANNDMGRKFWEIYQPSKEFSRMGIGSRTGNWRSSAVNKRYDYCPTYPSTLVVPSKISDPTLGYAVKYRSKGRIPGLVYLHWANFGTITRSSQPMVGIKNARSIQDEKLIESIFTSHIRAGPPPGQPATHSPSQSVNQITAVPLSPTSSSSASSGGVYGATATNLIVDARPTTNAVANVAKGAGTENMEYYKNCKKAYLGVGNIHVMRDSLNRLVEALQEEETAGALDQSSLRRTGWLNHISALLEGALIIVRNVHIASSHVLVHCSDGWDRTSQFSALAQVCLDPFYRTAEGYAILIEKDFLSFGHKFADRAGHIVPDRTSFVTAPGRPNEGGQSAQAAAFLASVQKQFHSSSHGFKESSPVFDQFLECTWQIMRQFPQRFEFDETFLATLHYHLYSCQYGTFLFNSEQARATTSAKERTRSVWETVIDISSDGSFKIKPEFRNYQYDPSLDDPSNRSSNTDMGVLLPDAKDVKFWCGLYGKDDEDMNERLNIDPVVVPDPLDDQTSVVVDSLLTDPVLNGVVAARPGEDSRGAGMADASIHSKRSTLQAPQARNTWRARSASPAAGNHDGGWLRSMNSSPPPTSGAPFQSAMQSFMKIGGSTWKSVAKGYNDVLRDFNSMALNPADEDSNPSSPKMTSAPNLAMPEPSGNSATVWADDWNEIPKASDLPSRLVSNERPRSRGTSTPPPVSHSPLSRSPAHPKENPLASNPWSSYSGGSIPNTRLGGTEVRTGTAHVQADAPKAKQQQNPWSTWQKGRSNDPGLPPEVSERGPASSHPLDPLGVWD